MEALAKATEARLGIAALREAIANGLPIAEAVDDDRAHPMKVADLLSAIPKWGPVRVNNACDTVGIFGRELVGDLDQRRRDALVAYVADPKGYSPHLAVAPAPPRTPRRAPNKDEPRARRYPARIAVLAQDLRGGGWSVAEVKGILDRDHGLDVSKDTIRRWTDPKYAAAVAARIQRRNRKAWAERWTFELGGSRRTPEYEAGFVKRMRDEGVLWPDVARVCGIVFGGRWTVERCKGMASEHERPRLRVAA
jgi:hypothetical protein